MSLPNAAGQTSDQTAPDSNILISLVVATFRRTTEFEAMLTSMLAQTERRFELIIVDQNKDDRLVPLVAPAIAAGIRVKHLRLAATGATTARNAGLEHASSELVAFPDDDCWFEADVVARAVHYFSVNQGVAGVIGHWVENDPLGKRQHASLSRAAWRRFKGGDAACFALFFRTRQLRELGGFSEMLGPGRYFSCAEEEDLIFRLLDAGAQIDYVPGIDIHHPVTDVPELTPQRRSRSRLYGRGTGAVQAKHHMPAWVIARGLVGPLYHGARSARPAAGMVLGAYTIWGRIEGLAGWWLWGRRQAQNNSSSPR